MLEQQRMMEEHRKVCFPLSILLIERKNKIAKILLLWSITSFQAQEQREEQTRMFKEQIQRQMSELDPIKRTEQDANYISGVMRFSTLVKTI